MNNYKVSEKRETVLLTKNQLAMIIIHSFLHRRKDLWGKRYSIICIQLTSKCYTIRI